MRARERGARAAVGALLSAAAVTGVVLLITTPWPGVQREALSVTAEPEPSASRVACGGATLVLGRDEADASALAAAAPQRVIVGVTPSAPDAAATEMSPVDVREAPAAAAFTADPIERRRTDLAAAGSSRADDPDIAGFAAAACTPPAMESWLAAGSGLTGAADVVVIGNPGDVASRVEITVFGVSGQTAPAAGADILVAPGTQRVVPLASLALGEQNPVVLVTATQAPVHASLQSSITRTLVPGGIDQSGATALPATNQTIPSFRTTAGEESAAETLVRVLAPSDDATATVVVSAEGTGRVYSESDPLALTAGVPLEVDVPSLPPGEYRVDIVADAPVVAALWAATGVDAGSDFAWHSSAEEISVPSLFAVAAGPSPRLAIAAPADADATVRVTQDAGEGSETEVEVPAGATVTMSVDEGEVYRLDPGSHTVRANVTYADDDALAAYPIVPADAAAAPVQVRPR